MTKIIISAVNLVDGGPLTILDSCLKALSHLFESNNEIEVIAIVNDKQKCLYPNIQYIELKWPKNNWLNRVYCEYFYFYGLSKKLKPDIWFSLHDMSPNVVAPKKIVYCHNPMPFYHTNLGCIRYNYKEYLFSKFYTYLYKINMRKNTYVIVQQNWIRDAFVKLFSLSREKVIVAIPERDKKNILVQNSSSLNKECLFFFPAFPRTFKNFEIICEACKLLKEEKVLNYKVILTLAGNENAYAQYIYEKYHFIENIDFCGLLSRERVEEIYSNTTCLIFPSKLETWGLPISEFANYGKPILAADLPYAYETAAGAKKVCFFNPNNPRELADKMKLMIQGREECFESVPYLDIPSPYVFSWEMLFDKLLA